MDDKILGFEIKVKGVSKEAEQIARVEIELSKLNEERKEANKLAKAGSITDKAHEAAIAKVTARTIKLRAEKTKLTKIERENNKQLDKSTKSTNTFGKAIGSFLFKANFLANVMSNVFSRIAQGLKQAVNKFISFEKIVGSNQITADKYDVLIGKLKGSFEALNRAIALGDFKGLADQMRAAADAAAEYVSSLDVLADTQNALDIQTARSKRQVKELQEVYNDTSRSNEDRLEAAVKASKILNDLQVTQERIAKETFDAELNRVQGTFSLNDEQIDAYRRFIENYGLLTDKQVTSLEGLEAKTADVNEAQKEIKKSGFFKVLIQASSESAAYAGAVDGLNESIANNKVELSNYQSVAKELSETFGFDVLPIMDALVGTNDEQRKAVVNSIIAYEDQLGATQKLINANAAMLGTIKNTTGAIEENTEAIEENALATSDLATEAQLAHSRRMELEKETTDVLAEELAKRDAASLQSAQDQEQRETQEKQRVLDLQLSLENQFTQERIAIANNAANIFSAFNDRALEENEARFQNGLISEQEYEAESLKLRQRQAIFDKAQALFNIGVNTAVAVTKITAEAALLSPFLIPAIIASGVLQAAAVASSPIPQFNTGGVVQTGGELPGSAPNTDNTLALVEPGEVVLTKSQQSFMGGPEMFRMAGVPGFATGGLIGSSQQPVQSMGNDFEGFADRIVKGINNKSVTLNINELHNAEDILDIILDSNGL